MNIPHLYTPRRYQVQFYNCLADGFKRALAIWHRRAGKDLSALNLTIKESLKRIGPYFYFFPTYAQGKKTIWDGFTTEGLTFKSYFPPGTNFNETELKADLPWGSYIQIIGTDKFDRIVGPNPVGCVFSEFALQDPRAWDIIRPILAENKGWALFLYTPRGKNHGWDLKRLAQKFPGRWFYSFLTVLDTKRNDGTPVISKEDIDKEREDGMSEDMVQQEFYCSFELGVEGSYYGKLMVLVEREGRILPHLYDPSVEVKTAWDLGVGDSCVIWFYQMVGNEIRLIDYHEDAGKGIIDYAQLLEDKRQEFRYHYTGHYAPFDVEQREKFSGRSVKDQAEDIGLEFTTVARDYNVQAGIEEVRGIFPRLWFDEKLTEPGRNVLENYRKEYNHKMKVYSNKPLHNWASHGADALRTLANAIKQGKETGHRMTADEVRLLEQQYYGKRV